MLDYCYVRFIRTKSDSELCSIIVMFDLIELNQKQSRTNLKQIVELTFVELI
jgi:hypothetical protein